MNCRNFERQTADWLSARLPPERAGEMTAHQKTCASCARIARKEAQLRERWQGDTTPSPAADLWPRLEGRLAAPEQGAARTRPGGIRRPQWVAATAITLAVIGSYSLFTEGRPPTNRAAPEGSAVVSQDHQAPVETVSSEAAVQSHAGAWSALGDVSRPDPAVDDPVGTNMENVWTYLKTDAK